MYLPHLLSSSVLYPFSVMEVCLPLFYPSFFLVILIVCQQKGFFQTSFLFRPSWQLQQPLQPWIVRAKKVKVESCRYHSQRIGALWGSSINMQREWGTFFSSSLLSKSFCLICNNLNLRSLAISVGCITSPWSTNGFTCSHTSWNWGGLAEAAPFPLPPVTGPFPNSFTLVNNTRHNVRLFSVNNWVENVNWPT